MSDTELIERICSALETEAAKHGIEIVDVEVAGSQKAPILRIRIDHADHNKEGITLDEVAAQNHWISDLLDSLDPFDTSYTLEVSSPGAARPLHKLADFERFAGNNVTVKLKDSDNKRKFDAELLGVEDGKVALSVDGEKLLVDVDSIKFCKIKPNFEF